MYPSSKKTPYKIFHIYKRDTVKAKTYNSRHTKLGETDFVNAFMTTVVKKENKELFSIYRLSLEYYRYTARYVYRVQPQHKFLRIR